MSISSNRSRSTSVRFVVVFVLIGILVTLLIGRYAAVMLTDAPLTAGQPTAPAVERGPILDRHGRILAIQTKLDTVWAWRPDVPDPQAAAEALSPVIHIPAPELADRLTGQSGSVTIKRTIPPSESEAIRELQEAGELVGIRLRRDSGRTYPEMSTLGPVIGFVGDDGNGLTGIEYTMEPWLNPQTENRQFGDQVFLTIDLSVQYESERLAKRVALEHQADSVVLLTMDARTGDVLGYASEPSFDPNRFRFVPDSERRNRPISDVYEPGSVFKIFTVASFLQLGGITVDSTFTTNGVYDRTDPPITDLANYGVVNTPGILRLSSNVGAATASETVSERSFYNMLKLFGFGEKTGIELNGEEFGILARPDNWSARTKPTLAIGQEIAVTALQLIAAGTVFANQGILLKPNIVDKVVSPAGRVIRDYGRTPVREVVSPEVANQVLLAMEQAVAGDGTGWRMRYEGLRIAGKTGTAEKPDPATGTYSKQAFVASTMAILPVDDPSLIVYIAIDNPKAGEFYGGRIAAPVVREYLDFLVPYLGIPVAGDTIIDHPGRIVVGPVSLPQMDTTVPDYTGLPKRVLLPLLERDDITVRIDGYGWVASQTPAPGTPVTPEMELILRLE